MLLRLMPVCPVTDQHGMGVGAHLAHRVVQTRQGGQEIIVDKQEVVLLPRESFERLCALAADLFQMDRHRLAADEIHRVGVRGKRKESGLAPRKERAMAIQGTQYRIDGSTLRR